VKQKYNGNALKRKFQECIKDLVKQFSNLDWEDEAVYAEWMAQTYFFVRHVTSLIALSAARFGPDRRDLQYAHHKAVGEEAHHDVMLLNDLKALGYKIEDFTEFAETAAFYQSQYYYIEHQSPVALIGASLSLEGVSASSEDVRKRLEKKYGRAPTSFISHHVIADQEHFKNSFEQIDLLAEADQTIAMKNLLQSTRLYSLMLKAIVEKTESVRAAA
jgi:hypothetical protein